MESLCYSATEKSECTLNASHSFTVISENLRVVQGVRFAKKQRCEGAPNRNGRDEAAAKGEGDDRYDKKNQIRMQSWRKQQLMGQ